MEEAGSTADPRFYWRNWEDETVGENWARGSRWPLHKSLSWRAKILSALSYRTDTLDPTATESSSGSQHHLWISHTASHLEMVPDVGFELSDVYQPEDKKTNNDQEEKNTPPWTTRESQRLELVFLRIWKLSDTSANPCGCSYSMGVLL